MEYIYSEYGYFNDLGQFFIPKIIQEKSKLKAYKDGMVTLVACSVEDGHIILKHHATVTRDEHKATADKPKGIRSIDELGRIILHKEHRESIDVVPLDAVVSFLLNDCTVAIRPLAIRQPDV